MAGDSMAADDSPTGRESAAHVQTPPAPKVYSPTSVTDLPNRTRSGPSDSLSHQYRALVPPPRTLQRVGLTLLAVGLGALGGGLLSRRRAPAPPRPVRRLRARADAAADLAPLVAQLAANPLVREYAVRLLLRQFSRRLRR